jgi:glycogen phosphorylase
LTIGFARRFATYKRSTLLFSNIERLIKLVTHKNHPVQFIFAGKAHPHDDPGKRLIQEIVRVAHRPELRRHIVFLEDYDLNCAHYLVQGVDVWLNTPRRPLEASGTSGMKAVFNGALNLSILDGWWDEGYNGENGWAIGRGEEYADTDYQDKVESEALFQILENEVIRLFYHRGPDDVPEHWVRKMKKSMTSLGPVFNTNRMVTEYAEKYYIPQVEKLNRLQENGFKLVKEFTIWKKRIRDNWSKLKIGTIETGSLEELPVGSDLEVSAQVNLGELTPDDVQVEIYYGRIDEKQKITSPQIVGMQTEEKLQDNIFKYKGKILCQITGQQGLTVRVLPKHPELLNRFQTNLVTWANT